MPRCLIGQQSNDTSTTAGYCHPYSWSVRHPYNGRIPSPQQRQGISSPLRIMAEERHPYSSRVLSPLQFTCVRVRHSCSSQGTVTYTRVGEPHPYSLTKVFVPRKPAGPDSQPALTGPSHRCPAMPALRHAPYPSCYVTPTISTAGVMILTSVNLFFIDIPFFSCSCLCRFLRCKFIVLLVTEVF